MRPSKQIDVSFVSTQARSAGQSGSGETISHHHFQIMNFCRPSVASMAIPAVARKHFAGVFSVSKIVSEIVSAESGRSRDGVGRSSTGVMGVLNLPKYLWHNILGVRFRPSPPSLSSVMRKRCVAQRVKSSPDSSPDSEFAQYSPPVRCEYSQCSLIENGPTASHSQHERSD